MQKGRPPIPSSARKRSQFNTRIRDNLRNQIKQAAEKNDRSFSEEVEFRIEASFLLEQFLADPDKLKQAAETAEMLLKAKDLLRR